MALDVLAFPRVGGTAAGGYYEVAPDVLVAVPREGYQQDEAGARASLRTLNDIAKARGRSLVTIILVDSVKSQDSSARRVWIDGLDPKYMCGLGLVASTLLARAIGSFYLGLSRPVIPIKMFGTIHDAVAWGREIVEQHGRPIRE